MQPIEKKHRRDTISELGKVRPESGSTLDPHTHHPVDGSLGLDTAMRRSLLPMSVALAINYGFAVIFHGLSLPDPTGTLLLAVTSMTFFGFVMCSFWFRARPPAERFAPHIGGLFAVVVVFNVTLHYWLTERAVYTAQYNVVVIVVGAVILSRFWMTFVVALILGSWVLASSTFFTTDQWTEYGGYLLATTALGVGLNVARVRMVTRLEATRQESEAGRETIRRAEADLREIIEKAPDGVMIHRGGMVIYANPAIALHLRAGAPEALVGRPVASLVHPESHDDARWLLEATTDDHEHGTYGFLRSDGELVMLEVSSTSEIHYGGEPALLVTARDVTARHEEIQARLLLADRMAAVGTMAAGVAHEINNPLAFVIDNLAVLANDLNKKGNEFAEILADTQAGADRIRRIVKSLKAFSRAEEGGELLEVRTLLESAIKLASNEIRHRARLVEDYADVSPVRGDGARLGQVFLNLVINAAQAIEKGRAEDNVIALSTSVDAEGQVIVTVRDTGSGISPEDREKIFDPFFTTKPVGVGTGLGLYFCHNVVVSELGGSLNVDSRRGTGTTFRIVLPPAVPTELTDVEPSAEELDETSALTILIIDDEPQIGRALRRVLHEHNVTTLTSPSAALEELDETEFDVILCDLMMPEMNGWQVYERLATDFPGIERRVAFMTGGAFTAEARSFVDTIDRPVLEKPIDHDELRRIIREVALTARV